MAQVITKADLFAVAEADIMAVVSLIRLFTCGRHQWALDLETVGAVEHFFAEKVPTLSGPVGALARKAWTTKTAWASPSGAAPLLAYDVSRVTIESALADLQRPGVLVVEDLVSDRTFLNAILGVFNEVHIEQALNQGWLEVRHSGGGGRVVAVTEDEALKFNIIARVGALIDSDSLYPSHHTHAHKAAGHLLSIGLRCHVLTYREVENYIPNRALAAIRPYARTNKRLGALGRLNREQRGHLDIKKGLGRLDGRFRRSPREHQDLYDGVPEDVLRALEDGFGTNVVSCLNDAASNMTSRDYTSLGADVSGELAELLSMIRSLI
jgi:hypothetical protein